MRLFKKASASGLVILCTTWLNLCSGLSERFATTSIKNLPLLSRLQGQNKRKISIIPNLTHSAANSGK
jgi:hypothetical protein